VVAAMSLDTVSGNSRGTPVLYVGTYLGSLGAERSKRLDLVLDLPSTEYIKSEAAGGYRECESSYWKYLPSFFFS